MTRLDKYGYNRFRSHQQAGRLRLLVSQFETPIILLLAIAAGLSFLLGERIDCLIVLVILLASGLLGFWQEYTVTNAVERLLSLVAVKAEARRSGALKSIPCD